MASHRAARAAGRRRAEAPRRWFGRGRTRSILALGTVLALAVTGTSAYWSDSATVSGITITAGSMDLRFSPLVGDSGDWSGAAGLGAGYTAGHLTIADLTPGESKAFNLAVRNFGDPDLTYAATVTRGGSWTYTGDPIQVRFYAGAVNANTVTYPRTGTCNGSALTGGAVTVTASTSPVIASPRTLTGGLGTPANGQKEQLCVVISMVTGAANANQGASGTMTFDFQAEQVVP